MPKHRDRSRSTSRHRHRHKDRSNSHSIRKKDRDRDNKHNPNNRSSSRSHERSYVRKERKSKFDIGPSGEVSQRKSKWSDQAMPLKQQQQQQQATALSNILFDTGIIKIQPPIQHPILTSSEIDSAITINAGPSMNSGGVGGSGNGGGSGNNGGGNGPQQQNSLQQQQAHLFSSVLNKNKIEANMNTHIETIRPNVAAGTTTTTTATTPSNPLEQSANPLLNLISPVNSLGIHIPHLGTEATKIKRKIYMPKDKNFNYTGLIIGPKGSNQKRLEEETGCKILVRGIGSQKEGQPPQPDDNEDQHVLIIGDNEMQIAKATAEIERIIFADEDTLNKIRQEQLKTVAALKNDPTLLSKQGLVPSGDNVNLSLTTPYGPPSPDAFIISVPNDCVGLVIGKGGETIKQLQAQSGAKKVQVAADSAPGSNVRNVFVEGDREAYERVKRMLHDIVEQQQKLKQAMGTGGGNASGSNIRIEVPVPDNLVGLIIGKGGETIKGINQRSGAVVYIPKECEPGKSERVLIVTGGTEQVEAAKQEIMQQVETGQRNLALKQLQAQGLSPFGLPLLPPGMLPFDPNNPMDPNLAYAAYYQQYLSSIDPNYAAMMYQQMYAQQQQQFQQQQQQQQQPMVSGITETIVNEPHRSSSQSNLPLSSSQYQK